MMSPLETIAEWIGENASNIEAGDLTENNMLGARRIIEALEKEGYKIVSEQLMQKIYKEATR